MENKVNYKGQKWIYEVDNGGNLWITHPNKNQEDNYEQLRPITKTCNLEMIVLEFLATNGY